MVTRGLWLMIPTGTSRSRPLHVAIGPAGSRVVTVDAVWVRLTKRIRRGSGVVVFERLCVEKKESVDRLDSVGFIPGLVSDEITT